MPTDSPLRFCANLNFLFTERDFPDRFAAAAAAGFAGVECLFPYDDPAPRIAGWLRDAGVQQVLFNLPPGDWAGGERGLACLPGREAEFLDGLACALDTAAELGCTRLHAMAGLRPAGVSDAELRATFVANLRAAARRAARQGITLHIEPINSRVDMPGYWLDNVPLALALLDEIGEDNVRLQFDAYHARVMHGDPLVQLGHCLPRVGHVQIADFPGRHEPGSGDIDFTGLFSMLTSAGYDGWIGCEYRPRGRSDDSFGWRPD